MMLRMVLILFALTLGSALAAPVASDASEADALAQARTAAQEFSTRLRSALQVRMQADGPIGAIDFCHDEAPRIAAAVMAERGVRLGRVAVPGRERNSANVAQDWQAAALATFVHNVEAGAAPSTQLMVQRENLPAGVALRMARGIEVEAPCLACHGRSVAAPVAAAIARHYPADAATGFDIGDLRGALWVEVPAQP